MRSLLLLASLVAMMSLPGAATVVASKKSTETVILGEIVSKLLRHGTGEPVHHRQALGGTRFVWQALRNGQVDVYQEYTGTLCLELLKLDSCDLASLKKALAKKGLAMSQPLGFQSAYALAMRRQRASRLGIESISDLREHANLNLAFSEEFVHRRDGWPGLRQAYGLPYPESVQVLDHKLSYRALSEGKIDVTDAYTADGELDYFDLVTLRDNRNFFPGYEAVLVYRQNLPPEQAKILARLEGQFSRGDVIRMNKRAQFDKIPESQIASAFLARRFSVDTAASMSSKWRQLWDRTREHFWLVGVSLLAAMVAGVPLGIFAAKSARFGPMILSAVGLLQTIPSLALLVLMIPLFGIGALPAMAALFLYSLLPIVRNTYAGLQGLEEPLRESMLALGLPTLARLRLVELPMAMPTILAGIKTSAVINVGTATLGALIGAGGYGQSILAGIRLDDMSLILQGALPAAAMALLVQWVLDILEDRCVSPGLRVRKAES